MECILTFQFLGVLHSAFSNGHLHLGKNLIEQGASQETLNLNGLDWKALSAQSGQDVEAVQAALDLDLQVCVQSLVAFGNEGTISLHDFFAKEILKFSCLKLQLSLLETKSANQSISETFQPKKKKKSTASVYLRELAEGIFPQVF
jgi:hypothetical protein